MWISKEDDFLNLSDGEYEKQLKDAWNNMSKEEKDDYKNNYMRFKLEMEEEDEDYFHIEDSLLEKFKELRSQFSGKGLTETEIKEITKIKGIKALEIEEGIISICLDDESLDEETREQLNWEYSFDIQNKK